jgi:DNA-binding IclR family transcriptional regulator
MTRCDGAILQWLDNSPNRDLVAGPAVVAANIGYAGSTVRQRMRELERRGLIEYHDADRGLYQLSDLGRSFLLGDVGADELE